MNLQRQLVLLLLKNPLIGFFNPLEKVANYLTEKLCIDMAHVVAHGISIKELFQVSIPDKLIEERRLLSYARLALCRQLKHDGLMSDREVQYLEDTILDENREAMINLYLPRVPADVTLVWSARVVPIGNIYGTDEMFAVTRQARLPWERNDHFFIQNPRRLEQYQELRKKEEDLSWYAALWWSCIIPGEFE